MENPTFEPEEGYQKVIIDRRKEELENFELLEGMGKSKKKKDKVWRTSHACDDGL